MRLFTQNDTIIFLLSITLMLGSGKLFGELFRRIKLPMIVGEIAAGILIGPCFMGRIAPSFSAWIFPQNGQAATGLDAFILLGVVLLLLIAGLEVDIFSVLRQGKILIWMSIFNIIIPFTIGLLFPIVVPGLFGPAYNTAILSLFIGIALSITALPVIAKILLDMNLIKSDFGMIVLASAMINDLFGWFLFSVIIQIATTGSIHFAYILQTIGLTIIFALFIIFMLRFLINITIPWIQAHTEWPGGVIVFIICTALLCSALSEAIGIHAIFGAFLSGIAMGTSPHLREHTKEIVHQFINNIFAPLFFVSIGLRLNLFEHFNAALTMTLIILAFAGKMAGSLIGGKISGLKIRDSFAIGSAMSARGAMEIIIGMLALKYGLISEEIFVAIVIMAIVTTLLSAPIIKLFLKPERALKLLDLLDRKGFIPRLEAKNFEESIKELSIAASAKTGLDSSFIAKCVLEREMLMSTGIGDNIAIPHARMAEIKQPYVVAGKSAMGIDFNAPDGKPANLIFLILTPINDQNSQIQILAQISHIFSQETIKRLALQSESFIEFTSIIKSAANGLK